MVGENKVNTCKIKNQIFLDFLCKKETLLKSMGDFDFKVQNLGAP